MASEVTIRGAGIFGLSIAWECLRRGATVTVIDPAGPGAGASGGPVGALAPHVPDGWNPKKAFQLDTLLAAPAFWAEIAEAGGGAPGYGRTGRLQPLSDAAAARRASARAAEAAARWRGQAEWRVVSDADLGSRVGIGWSAGLAHRAPRPRHALGAPDPPAAVTALSAAIRARGGRIVAEAPDRGAVVWATGAAGLEALSQATGQPVGRAIKGQAARLRHDAADRPQIFADGIHIVPHADGTVAIGSTTEADFTDPTTPDDRLEALIGRARALVPALERAPVVARWAGLRPRSRTRAPMLGRWPGRPGHFLANGGFKIGFGVAISAAVAMADLVIDGRDGIPEGLRVEDNLR